jgi:hypothetical protein
MQSSSLDKVRASNAGHSLSFKAAARRGNLEQHYGVEVHHNALALLRACAPELMYHGVWTRKVLRRLFTLSHDEDHVDEYDMDKVVACAAELATVGVGGCLANYRTNLCVFISLYSA